MHGFSNLTDKNVVNLLPSRFVAVDNDLTIFVNSWSTADFLDKDEVVAVSAVVFIEDLIDSGEAVAHFHLSVQEAEVPILDHKDHDVPFVTEVLCF